MLEFELAAASVESAISTVWAVMRPILDDTVVFAVFEARGLLAPTPKMHIRLRYTMAAKLGNREARLTTRKQAYCKGLCHALALSAAFSSVLSGVVPSTSLLARGFSYDKPTKNGVEDLPAIPTQPLAKPPSREVPPEEGPKKEPEKPKPVPEPEPEKERPVPKFDLPPEPPAPQPEAPPPVNPQAPAVQPVVAQPVLPAPVPNELVNLPNVEPWWNEAVQKPIGSRGMSAYSLSLENLVWHYLAARPQIQTFLSQPRPQRGASVGISDLNQVIEPIVRQEVTPISNQLSPSAGAQSNTLAISYSQPTRVGAELVSDYSSVAAIRLADGIDSNAAMQQLKGEAYEVCQSYWTVFYLRAALVQDLRAAERLESIANQLQVHANVEGTYALVEKAKSVVAQRMEMAKRTEAELSNAEAKLRKIVGIDGPDSSTTFEIIPITLPVNERVPCEINQQLTDAFFDRGEIRTACTQIHQSVAGQRVDANEVRNSVSALVQAYFLGSSGNNAWQNVGNPNQPIEAQISPSRQRNNLAVQSILQLRNLEMRKQLFGLNHQLLLTSAEVESTMTELEGSLAEYSVAIDSTLSAEQRRQFLLQRWQSNPAGGGARSALLLEELLNAESQVAQAENVWALSQCTYMISIAKVKSTTGKLVAIGSSEPNRPGQSPDALSHSR